MKQDRQGARTVQDLERKYQFNRQFSEVMGVAKDAQTDAERAKAKVDKAAKLSDLEPLKVDYIVETGETDGWMWRKWSSGFAECWKILTHKTAITTAWGSLYSGTATARQNYPFAFVGKPIEQASLTAGSYQAILFPEKDGNGVNGAYASACYNVCRPSSLSTEVEFYIAISAKGRWR